ncbi:NAD(P)H-hydrate epimerase [Microbacterium sp. P05]|uniref:NAD(P)H-hydrate epimerase n=1 Tax=Microbacterium sp. P05 TaxID=3366948 RepID=UPI0037459650
MADLEALGAYTAAAVRNAEAPSLEAGEPLMREAAAALAEVAKEHLARQPGRVLVLAGAGGNGGDALFAAAEIAAVADVDIVLTSDRVHREALAAALEAGGTLHHATEVSAVGTYALVLDGILGIGASADPRLRGIGRAVVEALVPVAASAETTVIAVDLPSGLHPDDGSADEAVLPADITVTFGAIKAGLVRGRGPELAGEIHVVDLGLGPALARARAAVTGPLPAIRIPRRVSASR